MNGAPRRIWKTYSRQRLIGICLSLNRYLSSYLHHPAGRYLEEVGGVARGSRERNEQSVLPPRNAGVGLRAKRPPRQEERRRHDVEVQAALARQRECLGHVGRLHESKPQGHAGETWRYRRELHPVLFAHARGVGGLDREDQVLT